MSSHLCPESVICVHNTRNYIFIYWGFIDINIMTLSRAPTQSRFSICGTVYTNTASQGIRRSYGKHVNISQVELVKLNRFESNPLHAYLRVKTIYASIWQSKVHFLCLRLTIVQNKYFGKYRSLLSSCCVGLFISTTLFKLKI